MGQARASLPIHPVQNFDPLTCAGAQGGILRELMHLSSYSLKLFSRRLYRRVYVRSEVHIFTHSV